MNLKDCAMTTSISVTNDIPDNVLADWNQSHQITRCCVTPDSESVPRENNKFLSRVFSNILALSSNISRSRLLHRFCGIILCAPYFRVILEFCSFHFLYQGFPTTVNTMQLQLCLWPHVSVNRAKFIPFRRFPFAVVLQLMFPITLFCVDETSKTHSRLKWERAFSLRLRTRGMKAISQNGWGILLNSTFQTTHGCNPDFPIQEQKVHHWRNWRNFISYPVVRMTH